jgi:hypothetical protein
MPWSAVVPATTVLDGSLCSNSQYFFVFSVVISFFNSVCPQPDLLIDRFAAGWALIQYLFLKVSLRLTKSKGIREVKIFFLFKFKWKRDSISFNPLHSQTSLRLVPMQAIVRAITPSRRRERGWKRARATRRALLPPPGDRQARAGRRVGDGVFAGESEGRQWGGGFWLVHVCYSLRL